MHKIKKKKNIKIKSGVCVAQPTAFYHSKSNFRFHIIFFFLLYSLLQFGPLIEYLCTVCLYIYKHRSNTIQYFVFLYLFSFKTLFFFSFFHFWINEKRKSQKVKKRRKKIISKVSHCEQKRRRRSKSVKQCAVSRFILSLSLQLQWHRITQSFIRILLRRYVMLFNMLLFHVDSGILLNDYYLPILYRFFDVIDSFLLLLLFLLLSFLCFVLIRMNIVIVSNMLSSDSKNVCVYERN